MKKRTRNILIAIGLVLLVGLGIVVYAAFSIYSFVTGVFNPEIPDEIKQARVLKGEGFLIKSEFFKLESQSFLKTIGESSKAKDEKQRQRIVQSKTGVGLANFEDLKFLGGKIIAVGEFGSFVFDKSGKLEKKTSFEPIEEKIKIGWWEQSTYSAGLDNIRVVELEKGKYGFLSFGLREGVRVFNHNGDEIWAYGKGDLDLAVIWESQKETEKKFEKETWVLEATVGDLNNDGISEYVVASKNVGIQAFNRKGAKLWAVKDEYPSDELTIIDLDGDGNNELVEVNSKVRDGNGKLIRELKTSGSMVLLKGNSGETKLQSCGIYENELTCENEKGSKILSATAPLDQIKVKPKTTSLPDGTSHTSDSISLYKPKMSWVRLKKDEPEYLAVVGAYTSIPRANFYVYNSDGKLVYHELLPEDAETIAVLPTDNGTEEILIGGRVTIWKYSKK